MTSRALGAVVGLGLVLLAALVLKDVLFLGGVFYERDLVTIYFPAVEAALRTLGEGAWPLRDPTSGFGQPILGSPDAQILYPPAWLNLFWLPERAYSFIALTHYVVGIMGAAALAWRFSRSASAAFFAGAFWLVGGPFQSFLTLWHHLAGAAWMPWVLTAFERVLERPRGRRVAVLGAVFGVQILAGSPDMCAMTISLVLLRLGCEAASNSHRRTLEQIGASLAALAIAACLGAATWLSAAEVVRTSSRASLPEWVRTYWSIHPALLAELAAPLGVGAIDLAKEAKEMLFEGREPFVRSLFLGPVVLPLFLGALTSSSIAIRLRVFAGVGVLLSALLSLGLYTPLYDSLTWLMPLFKILRFPSKLIIPVSLLCAVMAAVGISSIRTPRARRVTQFAAMAMAALHLAILLNLPALLRSLTPPDAPGFARQLSFIRGNLLLSLGAILILQLSLMAARDRLLTLSAIVAVGAAFVIHQGVNPVIAESVLRYRLENLAAVRTPEPSRLYVEDYVHFPEKARRVLGRESPFHDMQLGELSPAVGFVAATRNLLTAPVGGTWGIEYAWDQDLRGLFSNELRQVTEAGRDLVGTPAFLRLLQIANVSHAIALETAAYPQLELKQTLSAPPLRDDLHVFSVPHFLPRAYAVSGARILGNDAAAQVVLHPDFVPTREVVLEAGVASAISPTFESGLVLIDRRSDRTTLDVWLNEPGVVVLVEGFLPGWKATVDDAPAPVVRANALFLAVRIPAGRHRVIFTFRPESAVLSLSVSLLTVLGLLIGLLSERRRETDAPRQPDPASSA